MLPRGGSRKTKRKKREWERCNLNGVGSLDCYDGDIQSAIIYACTDLTLGGGIGTNDRAIVEYRPLDVVYKIDVVFTYQILSEPGPPQ